MVFSIPLVHYGRYQYLDHFRSSSCSGGQEPTEVSISLFQQRGDTEVLILNVVVCIKTEMLQFVLQKLKLRVTLT